MTHSRWTAPFPVLSAVLAAWLLVAMPAVAGPFEDAGAAYDRGDFTTAASLFRPLAEKGDAQSQFSLGVMYVLGQGVAPDYAQAADWFGRAADRDMADAQYNLAVLYANGQGVPQNYVEAHKWFNLAAARFPDSAKEKRDSAERNLEIVAEKMTPEQLAEARRLAQAWEPKS